MIPETVKEHVVEASWPKNLSDGGSGKAVEQHPQIWVVPKVQEELCVVRETSDEFVDMVAKFGTLAIRVGKVRNGIMHSARFYGSHGVRIDIAPPDAPGNRARDHPAHHGNGVI